MNAMGALLGLGLLVAFLVALAMYIWNGEWLPLGLVFVGMPGLMFVLGCVELALIPLLMLAKRMATSSRWVSIGLVSVSALTVRLVYLVVLLGLIKLLTEIDGPPFALKAIFAIIVVAAPFVKVNSGPSAGLHVRYDITAVLLGGLIGSYLLGKGSSLMVSAIPPALLFLIPVAVIVLRWRFLISNPLWLAGVEEELVEDMYDARWKSRY
jgi:hypothetical protein